MTELVSDEAATKRGSSSHLLPSTCSCCQPLSWHYYLLVTQSQHEPPKNKPYSKNIQQEQGPAQLTAQGGK